jgi:hypothetical protein
LSLSDLRELDLSDELCRLQDKVAKLTIERDVTKEYAEAYFDEVKVVKGERDRLTIIADAIQAERDRWRADFNDCNETREHLKQQVIKLRTALQEIVEYNRGDVASPEGEIARRALGVGE